MRREIQMQREEKEGASIGLSRDPSSILWMNKVCFGQVEISVDGEWTGKKIRSGKKVFRKHICIVNYPLKMDFT